jgi:hypothetical protein
VTKESFYIQSRIERNRITQNGIGGILSLRGLFVNKQKVEIWPSGYFYAFSAVVFFFLVVRFIPLDSPAQGLSIAI